MGGIVSDGDRTHKLNSLSYQIKDLIEPTQPSTDPDREWFPNKAMMLAHLALKLSTETKPRVVHADMLCSIAEELRLMVKHVNYDYHRAPGMERDTPRRCDG